MSGLQYQGGMNSYLFDVSQYGTDMPNGISGASDAFESILGSIGSIIPFFKPIVSFLGNEYAQQRQNEVQREMFMNYMSPQARMAQMKAAGINPAAAAQGISGSAAPQMNAAPPTNVGTGIGEQLGNSAVDAMSAYLMQSEARKNNADAALAESLNVKQGMENATYMRYRDAEISKLVSEGEISRSFANMYKVDEAYKPQVAEATYQQLVAGLRETGARIDNLVSSTVQQYAQAYKAMMDGQLSEAQINKVFSDIGVNNAMIRRINKEVQKMGYEIDVLVSEEAKNYQDINESEAREMAMKIQNQFDQDYYDIWQNTGFNWKESDVNKNIVGALQNMQIDEGMKMLRSVGMIIQSNGDSRSRSADYKFDKVFGVLGNVLNLAAGLGVYYGGRRGSTTTTVNTYDRSGGSVYQTGSTSTTTYER